MAVSPTAAMDVSRLSALQLEMLRDEKEIEDDRGAGQNRLKTQEQKERTEEGQGEGARREIMKVAGEASSPLRSLDGDLVRRNDDVRFYLAVPTEHAASVRVYFMRVADETRDAGEKQRERERKKTLLREDQELLMQVDFDAPTAEDKQYGMCLTTALVLFECRVLRNEPRPEDEGKTKEHEHENKRKTVQDKAEGVEECEEKAAPGQSRGLLAALLAVQRNSGKEPSAAATSAPPKYSSAPPSSSSSRHSSSAVGIPGSVCLLLVTGMESGHVLVTLLDVASKRSFPVLHMRPHKDPVLAVKGVLSQAHVRTHAAQTGNTGIQTMKGCIVEKTLRVHKPDARPGATSGGTINNKDIDKGHSRDKDDAKGGGSVVLTVHSASAGSDLQSFQVDLTAVLLHWTTAVQASIASASSCTYSPSSSLSSSSSLPWSPSPSLALSPAVWSARLSDLNIQVCDFV